MKRIPALDECNFYAETATSTGGGFVGRCREFPGLRTRTCKTSLDAVDQIITRVNEHIANLTAAVAIVAIQQRNKNA